MLVAMPVAADCARDAQRIDADFRAASDDVERIRDRLKADRRALDRSSQGARRDMRELRRLGGEYRDLDGQSLSHAKRKARNLLNDMERLVRSLVRTEQANLRDLRSMAPEHQRIARIANGLMRKTDALSRHCPGADVRRAAQWAAKNSRDGKRSSTFFSRAIDEKKEQIEWLRGYSDWIDRERNRARGQ